MPQSLSQIYVHLVFSTKERRPAFADRSFAERVFSYLHAACDGQECPAVIVGGFVDHVHAIVRLGRSTPIATLVREIKRESTKWIRRERPSLADFLWQSGYGAFSLGSSQIAVATRYVATQEERHSTLTYKDEFRRLCRRYAVESPTQGTDGRPSVPWALS